MVVLEDGTEIILKWEIKTIEDYIKWRSQYTYYGKDCKRLYDDLYRKE